MSNKLSKECFKDLFIISSVTTGMPNQIQADNIVTKRIKETKLQGFESFVNYHRNCLAVAVLDDFIQQAKENYQ